MGNDYIYNGIIGRRFRERQGREEYMSKISLFLFFVLMHAATAQSQYTYQPIDLGTNWIVSNDNQGGLCYSDGTQIFHLDQSGPNRQVLLAASELVGWSLTNSPSCLGSDAYVVAQRPSQQNKSLPPDFQIVRKRKGGTAQVILQTGQQFTFPLAGHTWNATPSYPYTQSGRTISYE